MDTQQKGMNMRNALVALAALVLAQAFGLTSESVKADEGQWQPYQMPTLAKQLRDRGIDIPAEQLADLGRYPMNAVVGLGYCTASFVSPQGLVLTNHHCAYRAIQYNSKKSHNYLKQGFLAKTLADEPSAGPSERLYITESVSNVTGEIIHELDTDPLKRYQQIQANQKAQISACESDENYHCSVTSYHNGLEYYLIKQLIIRDVRLVYAPPESVGAFGGDIDNYEYPRHAGDFSFLRAYVGLDGKPAPFHEDNVPYIPKSHLKINTDGVSAGDGVFAAGYPGLTNRHQLTSELRFASDWLYPTQAERYQLQIETIEAMGAENGDIAIKYAGNLASMANRMKKLNGLLDGFRATDIAGIKQAREDNFILWLAKDTQANQAVLAKLETLLTEQQRQFRDGYYVKNAQSSALLTTANSLYRLARERLKPDSKREPGYQQRDMKMFASTLQRLDSSFDSRVDKTLWLQDLEAYRAQGNRIAALDELVNSDDQQVELDVKLDGYYALTSLTDPERRLQWMDAIPEEFEKSGDPFIRLAVALYDANLALERAEKTIEGKLSISRPKYMQTLLAYYKANHWPVYPDANGTLRITYGMVDGYQSRDALYKQPFTRVEGMMAKHTGIEPFKVPIKLMQAIENKRYGQHSVVSVYQDTRSWLCRLFSCQDTPEQFNSIPVNFLSSVDTTGGNSGSPVFNGRGELVGLNFDSTYEAITKDWFFNPQITRAVHVDIRYILWMMDQVDHADNLIQELELVRSTQ
jgi:V8-like Glu-specific endopeptidase